MTDLPLRRRTSIALLTLALLAVLLVAAPEASASSTRTICFPNAGRAHFGTSDPGGPYTSYFSDTYGDPRSGHSHQGVDIMSVGGRKMRRLVSPVAGTVIEIVYTGPATYDPGSGRVRNLPQRSDNRVVIEDADGYVYVFLHMNNDRPGTDDGRGRPKDVYAPGLDVGTRVRPGQFIGYVGDSGNAEHTAPHNHFEIRVPGSGHWSHRSSINPLASLRDAAAHPERCGGSGGGSSAADGPYAPFTDLDEFIDRQYRDFYGRAPDANGRQFWSGRIRSGRDSMVSFVGELLVADEFYGRVAPIARLYKAYFDRAPEIDGLRFWMRRRSNGGSLDEVSQSFASSAEFRSRYGSLTDGEFVDLVYENVLSRTGDANGRSFWVGQLRSGRYNRGEVMAGFSESREYVGKTEAWTKIAALYLGMLDRAPDREGFAFWQNYWNRHGTAAPLIAEFLRSSEYAGRVERLRG